MTKNSNGNTLVKILIVLLVILLVLIVGAVIFASIFVNNKLNKIQHEELKVSSEELGISAEQQKNNKFRNIALLGIDSRYNDYEDFARTDCIMVASINNENGDINLFSIYRDTLSEMDLKGTTRLDKINHAYYGGVETTLKTINTNFDLNIDEYVIVDFEAVAELVNKVGGIELDITSDELKFINNYIEGNIESTGIKSSKIKKAGKQKIDGIQALAYSRIRYTEGSDFKRADRMRTVLEKTLDKIKEKSVIELNSLLDEMLSMIKTNISRDDINSLLPKVMNYNVKQKFGFPYNATSKVLDLKDYYEGTKKGADYYDIPLTLTEDVEKLHKEVLEESNYVVPQKVKEIEQKIKKTASIE